MGNSICPHPLWHSKMSQLRTFKTLRAPRLSYTLCSRIQPRHPYSSGSPTASSKPYDYFNKTGHKEASDPCLINIRTDEYSKSGGDDIVAEQVIASFKNKFATDPFVEKEIAGRGNVINPLELSPASPEMSEILDEQIVEKNIERDPSMKTGYGVTRKSKRVERTELDFRTK